MQIRSVCVFCASSSAVHPEHLAAAGQLGRILADAGVRVVYGGGSVGLMGALADGALAAGGQVLGVIPRFMVELEWAHQDVSELIVTADMPERLRVMGAKSDAFLALPGGCGTFEELFHVLTARRLGLHAKPVCMLDVRGYFAPCVELLERAVSEGFMGAQHRDLWCRAKEPGAVLATLRDAPPFESGALGNTRP